MYWKCYRITLGPQVVSFVERFIILCPSSEGPLSRGLQCCFVYCTHSVHAYIVFGAAVLVGFVYISYTFCLLLFTFVYRLIPST